MEQLHHEQQEQHQFNSTTHRPRPRKRTKWDEVTAISAVPSPPCELQPWIDNLINTDPSDCSSCIHIVQHIHSLLLLLHDKETDDDDDDDQDGAVPIIHDTSLISLYKILMVRMGYYNQTEPANPSRLSNFYILVVDCWKVCHKRLLPLLQNDPDTILVAFRMLVQLLQLMIDERSSTNTTTAATTTGTVDTNTGTSLETTTMVVHTIDLVQTWLEDQATTKSLVDNRQALLQEWAIVLIQFAQTTSMTLDDRNNKNDDDNNNTSHNNSTSLVSTIQDFLDTHTNVCSAFYLAQRILNHDNNVAPDSLSSDDWLFWLRCQSVLPQLQLGVAEEELSHPSQHEHDTQSLLSILRNNPANITMESKKVQAARILTSCIHQLSLDTLQDCIQVVLTIQTDATNDIVVASLLRQALACLQKFLLQSTNLPPMKGSELLDLCMTIVFDYNRGIDFTIQQAAGTVVITLAALGFQDGMVPEHQNRVLTAIRQLLQSSRCPRTTTVQAVTLVCDWIATPSSRTKLLSDCPEMLVSLAQVLSSHRVPSSEILAILQALLIVLEKETTNNYLARQPRVMESVVTLTIFPSGDSFEASLARQIRCAAMRILLCLSENPCNRRILAKHPGLLSSMIHCARQLSLQERSEHPPPLMMEAEEEEEQQTLSSKVLSGELKRNILLLAHAL